MQRLVVASIVLGAALTGFFVIASAQAMVVRIPGGLSVVNDKAGPAEKVAFVCSLVRRCGPYGCEERQCWETGYGYGPALALVTASVMFTITALNTVLRMVPATAPVTASAMAQARTTAAAITGAVAIAPRTVARPIGRVMMEAASHIAATE